MYDAFTERPISIIVEYRFPGSLPRCQTGNIDEKPSICHSEAAKMTVVFDRPVESRTALDVSQPDRETPETLPPPPIDVVQPPAPVKATTPPGATEQTVADQVRQQLQLALQPSVASSRLQRRRSSIKV